MQQRPRSKIHRDRMLKVAPALRCHPSTPRPCEESWAGRVENVRMVRGCRESANDEFEEGVARWR